LISSDIHPTTFSRSSSISFDNPSIDGLSLNDENQIPNSTIRVSDSPLPLTSTTPGLSSSLSELDPILNNRPRTPSPISSIIVDEKAMTLPLADKSIVIETIDSEPSTTESKSLIVETQPSIIVEKPTNISEKIEQSMNSSEQHEHSILSSLSISIDNGLSDLSVEPKTDDLLRPKHVDSLDL
ncbi:unnamed protein product, partial [Rotaria magnacalcarata]